MNLFAAAAATAPPAEASGLSINLFWVIVAALNFILFLALIWTFAFRPIANILGERKARIEQGLADAEQARRDRDAGAAEHARVVAEARRQAQALIVAAAVCIDEISERERERNH